MSFASLALAALGLALPSVPALATQITALGAIHHDGQTFLTWTSPAGTGWTYRVYRSASPIQTSLDLATADSGGAVGDSTWCDRRLSLLSGTTYGFTIDSLATPLDPTKGLFVWTPATAGNYYYAVTCQESLGTEDLTISPGGNSLSVPVAETPALPRPVFQRSLTVWGTCQTHVYTMWATNRSTPLFPAMYHRPSKPFDCAVHDGGPGPYHALMFHAHVRGGNFYPGCLGSDMPGEWVLNMDDVTRNSDLSTFWFGYQQDYDPESDANLPPTSGVVMDYTARRVIFTLEWARRTFPIDTTRIYAMGNSMGAIGAVFIAMWRPDLMAAVMAALPVFDFSYENDPNPDASFNVGGAVRISCDRLWGPVPVGLTLENGTPLYQRLNAGALACSLETRFVPPIFAFNGRNDFVVGWGEKIPFYNTMRDHRGGGTFFWDPRDHGDSEISTWIPMQNYQYLYRFRSNLSFPALTHCSADMNPGNGLASDGDSIGTINGFVEWDTALVDKPQIWQVRLTIRDLTARWGTVPGPDSLTVDVTPRRLQQFVVDRATGYYWVVTRTSDRARVQSGYAQPDALGLLTIPGVKVYRLGSTLEIAPESNVDVEPETGRAPQSRPGIERLACPVRGAALFSVTWPRAGEGSVEVVDLGGRRVRSLLRGTVVAGRAPVRLDPTGLPSGVYFIVAREGSGTAVRRIALLH
jgi:hypothetical protein